MFSKSTEYALRALIYLAQNSNQEQKIGLEELSTAIDSPKSFTAKILQKLTKNQLLVQSATGPGGGFYLTSESKNKSIYTILTIMEEESVLTDCVLGLKECSNANPCPMHFAYQFIKSDLVELFNGKTIQQLANELDKEHIVLKRKKKKQT